MNLGLVVLISLAAGAVINFFADALPRDTLRPVCMFCGKPLSWGEYARWWRPCPHCGKTRWRHGVVLALMVAAGVVWWFYPPAWGFWALWALSAYALAVIVMDVEHRLILNEVSAVGAVLGAALGIWRHGWVSTLLGGLAGVGVALLIYFLGNGYAAWKARRAGEPQPDEVAFGEGDVTLMGALGLLLGWPGMFAGLTLAIFLGGAFSVLFLLYGLLRWRRLRLDAYIPYGPFLVLGALWAVLLAR